MSGYLVDGPATVSIVDAAQEEIDTRSYLVPASDYSPGSLGYLSYVITSGDPDDHTKDEVNAARWPTG